ncbi:P-loop NTPase [soil metagenome]
MTLAVVTAADGASWESSLIEQLGSGAYGVQVVRRCVDVVDLMAVCATGQALVALVDADLRRFDVDVIERLTVAGVAVVAVVGGAEDGRDSGPGSQRDRLRALGVSYVVPGDAGPEVMVSVLSAAVTSLRDEAPSRGYGDPSSATGELTAPDSSAADVEEPPGEAGLEEVRGSVIVVWGPTGAPGRTTVAVGLSDELARLEVRTTLIDLDVYGGVLASVLGLLDESPGIAAACRQAQSRGLDAQALTALCWQVHRNLRVLTGIARADRWPELKASAVQTVLEVSRSQAEFTVLDVAFGLETDEELSFDTAAPRRNGATLAALDQADLILAVASADPIGIQRLIRGLDELRSADVSGPVWIVLNRVRSGAVPGEPSVELDAALQRFAGQTSAALLPYDRPGVDAATAVGKTLAEIVPNSPLRRALVELATSICGVSPPARGRRRVSRRTPGHAR